MNKEQAIEEMGRLIKAFPQNMRDAVKIGQKAAAGFRTAPVSNVLISGLGGSGIGGRIISQLVYDSCKVPIRVISDYSIPAFVGPDTLFIASSYSGNTEETLSTLKEAMAREAQISCITSGGELKAIAELKGYNMIEIPGGQPPRTSFGYNAMQLLFILEAYGLIEGGFVRELNAAADLLDEEAGMIHSQAAAIMAKIKGTTPVIYADTWFEGVSMRLRQQINENAKMLCWHHAFPEMNHNELVGWAEEHKDLSVILMRTSEEHPSTAKRMELSKEIMGRYTDKIVELQALGESRIERAYYLIHLGDWLSFYMAVDRDVDPIEIEVIDYFKAELAKG
ncbi:MAG: bifunctional phosphoglucose/phosphomannose isomerase [Cryomorphaceae bacterium]